jgi:hypothetical protein
MFTVHEEPDAKEPDQMHFNNKAYHTNDRDVPPKDSRKSLSPTRGGEADGSARGRYTITGSTCADCLNHSSQELPMKDVMSCVGLHTEPNPRDPYEYTRLSILNDTCTRAQLQRSSGVTVTATRSYSNNDTAERGWALRRMHTPNLNAKFVAGSPSVGCSGAPTSRTSPPAVERIHVHVIGDSPNKASVQGKLDDGRGQSKNDAVSVTVTPSMRRTGSTGAGNSSRV